jgi:hypothetical protein
MTKAIIRLVDYAENLDPTGRIVREQPSKRPGAGWTIYSVRKGFLVTLPDLMAIDGVFATEREAVEAAEVMEGGQ